MNTHKQTFPFLVLIFLILFFIKIFGDMLINDSLGEGLEEWQKRKLLLD